MQKRHLGGLEAVESGSSTVGSDVRCIAITADPKETDRIKCTNTTQQPGTAHQDPNVISDHCITGRLDNVAALGELE